MIHRILDAFRTAPSQQDALTAVARILQGRNPRLSIVAAIIHADAIADALYRDEEGCATLYTLKALADKGN